VLRRILSLILIVSLLSFNLSMAFAEIIDVAVSESETFEDDIAMDEVIKYRELVRGDRDGDDSSAVLLLQNKLVELGYLSDSADGIYGGNTEKAIATFQRIHELEETGVADFETQQLLFEGGNLIPFMESDDPESVTFRTETRLTMWGFMTGVPTGVVNQKTDYCVSEFKEYLPQYLRIHPTLQPELTPSPTESTGFGDAAIAIDIPISTGDEITQDVLDFVDGNQVFEVYTETLSSGDEGLEVLRLQRRLYSLNYLATADGKFSTNTERALIYFQKKNGLNQSAVADEATQRLLYSEDAVASEEFVNQYKMVIDVSDQRVYVYQWNGSDYNTCVREMICSSGLPATPTPLGTYQAAGPTGTGEWYYFKEFECYAKWATRIVGGILFHSTTYSRGKVPNKTAQKKLGRRASHGCVRLTVDDALWTYENCAPGTTVVVQD